MKIITRQNLDGSFNDVGMNNRAIMPEYKQEWRTRKWVSEFGNGRKTRIECFRSKYDEKPYRIDYIDKDGFYTTASY